MENKTVSQKKISTQAKEYLAWLEKIKDAEIQAMRQIERERLLDSWRRSFLYG